MYMPLFLSYKFLRTQTASLTLSFITTLCISSIIISSAALGLIAAIMQGFHDATLATLKGASPDLIIKAPQGYLDTAKIKAIIHQEFRHTIASATPCNFYHMLLQNTQEPHDFSHVCFTAALDPAESAPSLPFLFHHSCQNHHHTMADLHDNTIIIGNILARDLNITCGDTIVMRYLDEKDAEGELSFLTQKMHVTGIFHSGIEDWDSRGACIALPFAHSLFDDTNMIQQLHIKLHSSATLTTVQHDLHKRLQLSVISWSDMNAALVSALALEKSAMVIILILILLIAGITLASLLSLQLIYHKRTIAVLAVYGMPHRDIITTFIIYGMVITIGSTLVGLSIASGISYCIDHYKLIALPEVYYTTHVPAHMSWTIIETILFLSCVTSALVSWYPARSIRKLPLARIIADV